MLAPLVSLETLRLFHGFPLHTHLHCQIVVMPPSKQSIKPSTSAKTHPLLGGHAAVSKVAGRRQQSRKPPQQKDQPQTSVEPTPPPQTPPSPSFPQNHGAQGSEVLVVTPQQRKDFRDLRRLGGFREAVRWAAECAAKRWSSPIEAVCTAFYDSSCLEILWTTDWTALKDQKIIPEDLYRLLEFGSMVQVTSYLRDQNQKRDTMSLLERRRHDLVSASWRMLTLFVQVLMTAPQPLGSATADKATNGKVATGESESTTVSEDASFCGSRVSVVLIEIHQVAASRMIWQSSAYATRRTTRRANAQLAETAMHADTLRKAVSALIEKIRKVLGPSSENMPEDPDTAFNWKRSCIPDCDCALHGPMEGLLERQRSPGQDSLDYQKKFALNGLERLVRKVYKQRDLFQIPERYRQAVQQERISYLNASGRLQAGKKSDSATAKAGSTTLQEAPTEQQDSSTSNWNDRSFATPYPSPVLDDWSEGFAITGPLPENIFHEEEHTQGLSEIVRQHFCYVLFLGMEEMIRMATGLNQEIYTFQRRNTNNLAEAKKRANVRIPWPAYLCDDVVVMFHELVRDAGVYAQAAFAAMIMGIWDRGLVERALMVPESDQTLFIDTLYLIFAVLCSGYKFLRSVNEVPPVPASKHEMSFEIGAGLAIRYLVPTPHLIVKYARNGTEVRLQPCNWPVFGSVQEGDGGEKVRQEECEVPEDHEERNDTGQEAEEGNISGEEAR